MRLSGKVAIVTGAARGTGAETARLLAEQGARVLLGDVLDDRGEAVAKEIGDAARYLHLDVREEGEWERAVQTVEESFGPPNVLVNNAAILDVASIADTTLANFENVVRTNLIGSFLGLRQVIEPMKRAGGGSIINVASIDALESHNGVVAYASSKWGIRGLTKTAAIELARHGIRVNTLCPAPGSEEMAGPFRERLTRAARERGEREGLEPPRPGGRGELRDVANAIAFLASDESRFVSGADLPVDGGFTAGKVVPVAPFS